MTTTTAWAHLPNAKHIDAVLADVKARPAVWATARDAAWPAAQHEAWHAARDAVWEVAGGDAWNAVWGATGDTALGAAWDAAESAAWCTEGGIVRGTTLDSALSTVRIVLSVLIAWDATADLVDLSPDALRALVDTAPAPVCHQAALLLLWAVVRETT